MAFLPVAFALGSGLKLGTDILRGKRSSRSARRARRAALEDIARKKDAYIRGTRIRDIRSKESLASRGLSDSSIASDVARNLSEADADALAALDRQQDIVQAQAPKSADRLLESLGYIGSAGSGIAAGLGALGVGAEAAAPGVERTLQGAQLGTEGMGGMEGSELARLISRLGMVRGF